MKADILDALLDDLADRIAARMQNPVPAQSPLKVKELATMMNVHPSTIRRQIQAGEIATVGGTGRAARISRAEADRLMKNRPTDATR